MFATPQIPFLRLVLLSGVLAGCAGPQAPKNSASNSASSTASALTWPEITRENKPWTRWYWPGSAVDKLGLSEQMEQIAAAGIGGVEIEPIYGARGYEAKYLDFLSPPWMEMLTHAGREGQRLGLGVDMATGTGWPFGGPWIKEPDASSKMSLKNGRLTGEPTHMMVKRAAPGDEGWVVDPYSPDALRHYLAPFDRALADFPRGLVRSQFHDSFEYYGASWTAKFEETFRQMHGYEVQPFATALAAESGSDKTLDAETLARIKSDYRDTLARLHLDYLRTWVQWSHDHGFLVRNQSHGAPGNLLDLYANADIAETEVFGSTPFPIPGLRRNADEVRRDLDLPDSGVIRMASSASHVVGHNLTSSETFTWLRDNWKVALSYTKPEIDRLFCDGINHLFYQGTSYSPRGAPWPGWFFYAETQFSPANTWWDDARELNRYVGRVQSVLQRGRPDNDILLYWPIEDIWHNPDGLQIQLTVHTVKWLHDQPVGKIAEALMARGYAFDYISDAQLQQTRAESGGLATPGAHYKVIVVPATKHMPVATLQRLAQFAQDGATVIFEKLPEDVPGYGQLEERRRELKEALRQLDPRVIVESDILGALASHRITREPIVDSGIRFIRRATTTGHDYFFANLGAEKFAGWATLGTGALSAAILDPLTGATGAAALHSGTAGKAQIYLQLAPGESLLVRTDNSAVILADKWAYRETAGAPVPLAGIWKIEFLKGGPELPPALQTTTLKSWTELDGSEAQRFGGTARYRLEFEAPSLVAEDWLLNLGEVRESARVRLNGREVGTAWSLPFQLRVGQFLRPGVNMLEIDVTNLAANRIRDLDQRGVNWKIMREINLVNINYEPFDAYKWALTPSGLIGPVTLTPLKSPTL